jgi:membrane protein DedA with SNARE-associated domain
MRRRLAKYAALLAILVGIVVVPFILWGDAFDALAHRLISLEVSALAIAGAGIALLASDVFLPVPSSVVISLMGGLIGVAAAIAAGALGLSLGCVAGYLLGKRLGRSVTEQQMGREDYGQLTRMLDRHGAVMLAACRPVPVLAEASVIAAGIAGMPMAKTLAITGASNVGVAGVYALLGASAGGLFEFALVLVAALVLPGLLMLGSHFLLHRSEHPPV